MRSATDEAMQKLSTREQRQLSRMINQQFWLFGYDVRHPGGNILLDLGFEKCRPPADNPITSSRYCDTLPGGMTVCLWGFGMYISTEPERGLFVSRNGLTPYLHTTGDLLAAAWNPWDTNLLRMANSLSDWHLLSGLLIRGVEWIGSYEQTILDRYGIDHRQKVLDAWKRACCAPCSLPQAWASVSQMVQASTASFQTSLPM